MVHSDVQALNHVQLFAPHGLQHARLPCPSLCPEFAQTHVHWVSDAIQLSNPPPPPSSPEFSLSQHQSFFFPMSWLFTSGGQSIGASASASDLPMNIQCSFPIGLMGLISLLSKGFSKESFPASQFESFNSSALSVLYDSTLTFVRDDRKNHSFDYMHGPLLAKYNPVGSH